MGRTSFRDQIIVPTDGGSERSDGRKRTSVLGNVRLGSVSEEARGEFFCEIDDAAQSVLAPFESKFKPGEMRQLALVAHNHMKPAMKDFIQTYSEVLKKFRITGTQTTMRMCKTLWGETNPEIEYGQTCTSGPLGGDAQIAALMCLEDLGALIFFVDPLSAHPHQADIDSLVRLSNCGNVIVCPNPTSAMSMMHTLKLALEKGSRGMIPSFFETLESPAVAEYKRQQELALAAAVASGSTPDRPPLNTDPSMFIAAGEEEEGDDAWSDDGEDDAEEVEEMVIHAKRMSALTLEDSMKIPEGSERPKRESAQNLTNLYGLKQKKPIRKREKLMKNVKKSVRNVMGKFHS